MTVVGIILIVVGFGFILLAMVAGAKTVFDKAQPSAQAAGAFDPAAWAKLVTAITNFVKVAPGWLLFAAVGAGLVAWGATML
jgi:hypothetical protein